MASKKKKKSTQASVNPKILIAIGCAAAVFCVIGIIVSSIGQGSSKTGSASGSASASAANASGSVSESGGASGESASTSASETTGSATGSAAGAANLAVSADDINISHYAAIDIKDYGTVTVALDESAAPETVKNFVSLAESGFYNGLTFHRIIDGFMMQGGDPLGNGTGGSDKTIKGEFSENGVENNLSHTKGAISMARSGDPNSASSQFFIVQEDSTFLDGSYAAFGYVTEGQEIVDKICKDAKPTDDNGSIKKEDQPVINSISIEKAGS